MKDAINKLIKEYEQKENDLDVAIEKVEKRKRGARRSNNNALRNSLHLDLMCLLAQKVAYVQSRADINSLIDYL